MQRQKAKDVHELLWRLAIGIMGHINKTHAPCKKSGIKRREIKLNKVLIILPSFIIRRKSTIIFHL